MTTHAKLSPSKRHRWGACPGSVREERAYPEDRSGTAAIDGTHSHTLLEHCIRTARTANSFIGHILKDGDGEFSVDKVRAERVDYALDYILPNSLGKQLITEQQVDPAPIFGRDDLSGHVDVQIVGDDTLEVIDYKDGMAVVNATDNPQLEQYAFGCLCAHQDREFKTIKMTIIQPKLREKGLTGIDSWEITKDELMGWRMMAMSMQAAATDAPDAPLIPGEVQCKYCKHKGSCSAMANKVMEASGITFENLDLAKQAADKEPTTMTDDQIREILEAAPLIRQMLDGVEAEALRRFEAGHEIAGLKCVRGRGSRAWAFDDEQMAEKLKKFGLPKDAIWETKLISPAKAEKVRWTKRDGSEHQLNDKQLAMLKSEYIKKSDGKPTVVAASDDRPAVTISATSLFGVVADLPDFLKPL